MFNNERGSEDMYDLSLRNICLYMHLHVCIVGNFYFKHKNFEIRTCTLIKTD